MVGEVALSYYPYIYLKLLLRTCLNSIVTGSGIHLKYPH